MSANIAYAFSWPGRVMSNNQQIKHPGRNGSSALAQLDKTKMT